MDKKIKINKNSITQSVILALVTLISAFVWVWLKNFLFSQGNWYLPLVGFFIISILLCLGWILLRSKIILFTTLAIILIGYFVSFGFGLIYLIAGLIALGLFFFGSIQAIEEKDLRIKIKVRKIIKAGLPSFLTGLILLIIVPVYFSPIANGQIKIPRPLFDMIYEIMPMPNLRGNLLENLNLQGIDLKGLDLSGVNLEGTNLTNFPIQDLAKTFPILGAEQEQKDAMYNMFNEMLLAYIEPYKQFLAIGFVIGLFFILKSLSIPFSWLVALFVWLVFKLLVAAKAIGIHEKSVLQEVIE